MKTTLISSTPLHIEVEQSWSEWEIQQVMLGASRVLVRSRWKPLPPLYKQNDRTPVIWWKMSDWIGFGKWTA